MATTDYSLAHSLPANVEAERSILGAILLDNFAYNQAAEHLKPEDFSLDSHRRIYTRMMDLAESSRPIDMITLVEEFDRHKELEAIGDVGYISGLVDGVPDRPSIEHYIKIVRDKSLMRGLIHAPIPPLPAPPTRVIPPKKFSTRPKPPSCSFPKSASAAASWACRKSSRNLSDRWMHCCSAASASPDWPRITPIWTR